MKKKSLFLILTMVLMLMVSAVTVFAAPSSGSCGTNVSYVLDSDGVLTISGYGKMNDYTSSSWGTGKTPWTKTDVKKVVVNEGVTSIGNYAFYNCQNLTEISRPSTLETVGQRVFYGTKVTKVVFPEGVTSIGEYCFTENTYIKEVVLPDSLTTMGKNCFYNCENLEKVTMSKNLTAIPAYAFYGCSKLTDISMPTALTSIGERAFSYSGLCNRLLVIPDSVTTIGENAFRSTDIIMVKLPANLTAIPKYCFYGCGSNP